MRRRILASALGAVSVVAGFAVATPTVALAVPSTLPAGTEGTAACAGNDVLLLIDKSASLKKSDPQHERVDAAEQLVGSLAKAATPASPITVSIAGFGTTVDPDTPDMFNLPSEEAEAVDRLEQLRNTPRDQNTDYILALQKAADYVAGLPAVHCRPVLLFTDGAYDIDDPEGVGSYTTLTDPAEINADLGNQVCGPLSPTSLLSSPISEQLQSTRINLTFIDLQTDNQSTPERTNTKAVLDHVFSTDPTEPCRVPGELIRVDDAAKLGDTFTRQAQQIFDAQQVGAGRSPIDCTTLANGLPAGAVRSVAALAADPADPVVFDTPAGGVGGPVHDFTDAERTLPGEVSLAADPSAMHACYASTGLGIALDGDPHLWSSATSSHVSFAVGGPQSSTQSALSLGSDALATSATVDGAAVPTTWDGATTRRWTIDVPGPYSSNVQLHVDAHLLALDPSSNSAAPLERSLTVDQQPSAPIVNWIGPSTREGRGSIAGELRVTPTATIGGQVCIQFDSTKAALLDDAGGEIGSLSLASNGETCFPDAEPFDVEATLDIDHATNAGASSALSYSSHYVDAKGVPLAATPGTATAAIVLSKPADTGRLIVVALLLVLASLVVPTGVLWLLARRQSRLPDPSGFIMAGVALTTNDDGTMQPSGEPLQMRDLHTVRGSRNRFDLSGSTAIRRRKPRHPFASLSCEAAVADGTVDAVPQLGSIGRRGRRRHLPTRFRNVVVVHRHVGADAAEGFVIVPSATTPSAASEVLRDALTKLNRCTVATAPSAARGRTAQPPATAVDAASPQQHSSSSHTERITPASSGGDAPPRPRRTPPPPPPRRAAS